MITVDYKALKEEIALQAYSGMTDKEIIAALSVKDKPVDRDAVSASEIFNAIDLGEMAALTADNKVRVDRILGMGSDILVQGNVKAELSAIFDGASATRTALLAMIKVNVSRAAEIGINPDDLSMQAIESARTGSW